MTELGFDIQEEILLRLEVKDLFRCKSACKSWNSLISSPGFINSHLDHILSRRHTNEIGDTRIFVSHGARSMCIDDCFCSSKGYCKLIGSSNGLVCISRQSRCKTDFLVVNPSTREVKKLRKLPQSGWEHCVYLSGFGYDSSIDDFKVIIGYRYVPNDYLHFQVLELKTNIWRELFVDEDELFNFVGDGILCNGAFHWLDWEKKPSVIVSFDLSREVFKEIPLPKLDGRWKLGTMKDRLCVFGFPNINIEEIEIWVMRNDNVQVPWERMLLPPSYDTNKLTFYYIPHKNFLSGLVYIWLSEEGSGAPVLVRSIDHPHSEHHEHIRLSTYSECNYNYDKHVFVKSLVSPHGMGDGDGDDDSDGDGDDDGDDDGDGDGDDDGGDGNINDAISLSTLFL